MANIKLEHMLNFTATLLYNSGYKHIIDGYRFKKNNTKLLNECSAGHILVNNIPFQDKKEEFASLLFLCYHTLPPNIEKHMEKYSILREGKLPAIPILHKSEPLFRLDPYRFKKTKKRYSMEEQENMVKLSSFHNHLRKHYGAILYFNIGKEQLEKIVFDEVEPDYSHLERIDLEDDEIDYKTHQRAKAYQTGMYKEETNETIAIHRIVYTISLQDRIMLIPRQDANGHWVQLKKIKPISIPIPQIKKNAVQLNIFKDAK